MKKIGLGLLLAALMLLRALPADVLAAEADTLPAVVAETEAVQQETEDILQEAPVGLSAPELTVSGDPATGKAVLSWNAVDGAKGYAVYRSTSSKKNFKQVEITEETSVTLKDGTVGKKYYYKVMALGQEAALNSGYSKTLSHTCVYPRPEVTAVSGKSSGIKLNWKKISGAKKYQIYRSDSIDGEYTKIKTTTALTYTDTKAPKNQVSYYQVRTYGEDTKTMSAFSEPVSLMNHTFGAWQTEIPGTPEAEGLKARTCSDCGHREETGIPVLTRTLAKPKLTVATDLQTGKVKLSWKTVEGAQEYYIYLVDQDVPVFLTSTGDTSYIHKQAVTGNSYTYRIMAVSDRACSDYSAPKTHLCKCARPDLHITGDPLTGNPVFSWEAVEGAGEYVIYRSSSKDKNFKELARTTEPGYLLTGGTAGKTHYYRIKAVGILEGTDSGTGTAVKHVWDCARPVITVSAGTSGGLKISWEKVAGAQKYQVYRADSVDGTYTKIKTTSSLTYTDTKAAKNQVSYYKVRAYGAGTESMSAYSEPAFALNHTYTAWTTVLESSPEAPGVKERVCTGCDSKQQQNIPQLERKLKTPVVTAATDELTGKPALSWKKISGATGYRVYLVDETGARQYLETVKEVKYLYPAAVAGNRYTFCVAAVSVTGCSDYSEQQTLLCKCAQPQMQIKMDPQSYELTLSWEQVEGAAAYDIYKASALQGEYTLLTHTDRLSVTVPDATPGVPLYFKIQAKHRSTPEADSGLSGVVTLDGQTLDLVIHAGKSMGTCNKVVWNRVKGARSYEVYRATSPEGSFKKIATVKGSEHVELSVPEGTAYAYMVKAIGAKKVLLATSQVEVADKPCLVPLKIYVSPSSQKENLYSYGNTNEAKECRKIAKALVAALERCGFTAMTNLKQEMEQRLPESNAWGANLHVAIHSNAFNASAMGTQIYHDGVSGSISMKATKAIFAELAPLSPGSSGETIRKHADYYEFNDCNNPTTYIEVAFHDTKEEAKWIIKNTEKIAEAICKGICKTYGVTYIAP